MADEEPRESLDEMVMTEEGSSQPQEDAERPAEKPVQDLPVDGESPQQKPSGEEPAAEAGDAPQAESPPGDLPKVVNEGDGPEGDPEAAMLSMLEDLPKEESGASAEDIDFQKPPVANAEFRQLSKPAGQPQSKNIDMLMDINLPVSIELGRAKMSIADILSLGPGSVVELNKLAGEPVDVMVNYKLVARGEVVVIDENFGVRITQLMTPEERLRLLGEEQ